MPGLQLQSNTLLQLPGAHIRQRKADVGHPESVVKYD
jgi:hypothetical protein